MPTASKQRTPLLAALAAATLLAGCGASDGGSTGAATAPAPASTAPAGSREAAGTSERFPDIRKATLTPTANGVYEATVTVSSPYDTPERYADGWRVLKAGTDEVLGEHMLAHDHADEQPFSRTQSDLKIPDGVSRVTIQGRDQDNGYGGETVTIDVPRS